MKQEEPNLPIEMQNESISSEIQNKILLICDFTGNIVFWKGDSKVFQLPPSQYLKKNFLSFDFTLFSRLTLASNLTMDIFKHNKRKEFQLEIIKKSSSQQNIAYEKVQKFTPGKIRQYLLTRIKFLKVAASTISGCFEKLAKVGVECELKSLLKCEKDQFEEAIKGQSDQRKQIFLMFQVEEKPKQRDALNSAFLNCKKTQEIRNKLWDFEFVKRKKIKISQSEEGRYENDEMKQNLDDPIQDIDFDGFFNSKSKSSVFKPNRDFFNKFSESKSQSKEEQLFTPGKEKAWKVEESPVLRRSRRKMIG